ncbi:MAG: chromosomal replication initiator DnaA [Brevundimonas sp.]|nr:MAG: chromosomal replication initiator DnaA [Brevundimonas sp.]
MSELYEIPVADEDRIKAELALTLVAASIGFAPRRLRTPGRMIGADGRARRLAVYLAYVTFGWTLDRAGHAFGLNRTTAANCCRWVEDARDSKPLDELLDHLEDCAKQVLTLTHSGLPA